ncbi:MAG: hypothetical protein IPK55_11010 [Streptococcus sp.]|nr:hypothetical protein [Streptococcus sp.]
MYETLIKEEKGFTIGEKRPEKGFEDGPAPGQYTVKSSIGEGPQYSIYERRETRVEQTPGPGEYELKEEGGKGVTIGERLKERKPEDLPAPGQYEIKSRIIEGPQYSVGEKRYTKIEQTPGPGEYEHKDDRGHGVTIGERLAERRPEDLPCSRTIHC